MVYLFLAEGFEIIEALAPVDMLRRGKIDVKTVGVTGKTIKSSCGVEVTADMEIAELDYSDAEAVILPGGLPGTINLENNETVQKAIDFAAENGKLVCAICAAPSVLGHKGLLDGREAIAFPGFEKELMGAKISEKYVVVDGNFITARGAGVATEFGLEIVKQLKGEELSDNIRNTIQCQ